ncbi:MAG: hypothetical protein FWF94_06345 [Oscillospiraceae bacterium]|nr:hypothetical protein [Oscillospiraceae bacterium]
MSVNRQQLHDLIDVVNPNELDVLFCVLSKFISEDTPLHDEIEAIEKGRNEIRNGEYVNHHDINWD